MVQTQDYCSAAVLLWLYPLISLLSCILGKIVKLVCLHYMWSDFLLCCMAKTRTPSSGWEKHVYIRWQGCPQTQELVVLSVSSLKCGKPGCWRRGSSAGLGWPSVTSPAQWVGGVCMFYRLGMELFSEASKSPCGMLRIGEARSTVVVLSKCSHVPRHVPAARKKKYQTSC